MANSAYFDGAKPIFLINEAVTRVGRGPVQTLVVASLLHSAFPTLKTLNLKEY